MLINGTHIDLNDLTEDEKQIIANFEYVKKRSQDNRKVLEEAAKDSVVLDAAVAHLANAVEDIVQRCTTKGEANDASEAE